MKKKVYNLAIFASGSGTNAEQIILHFQNHPTINVRLICSNKVDAYVLKRAENHQIDTLTFLREDFKSEDFLRKLDDIDCIILAGFLWLIPPYLINAFPEKIINIHPSLLPKYGGKGMYGSHVHKAVIEANEQESGITIHLVNQEYDKGKILFQTSCPVKENDTPDSLADSIHQLEHQHFPTVIEKYLLDECS